MLEVKNLHIDISNNLILKDISFKIKESEALKIVGRNGVGKTSFLKSLVCLINPSSGKIYWENTNICSSNIAYINNLSYLSHKNYLNESLTVYENLEYFFKLFTPSFNKNDFKENLKNILIKLKILHKINSPAWKLSQGQKQKVAIARVFISCKQLLILDEPFVSLDTESKQVVWGMIKEHLINKGMVLFTSHQNDFSEDIKINQLNLDNFAVR